MFWLLCGIYLIVFLGTSYRLYNRLGVFGCGDECINYTAAHFLTIGKSLYTEVFFNRQPLMAIASVVVQWVTNPTSLYSLVLYHRVAITIYALVMGVVLILRFRIPALLFLMLYEGTKFYMYGYQFIGEAVIVYPLAYTTAAVWHVLQGKRVWNTDWYLVPLFAAVVFWTREPYIPAAFVVLGIFVWALRKNTRVYTSVFLSLILCIAPYLVIPIHEYIRQVIEVNAKVASSVWNIQSILLSFGYPLAVFISGKQSYFRMIEIGIMVFIGLGIYLGKRTVQQCMSVLIMFGILGFAAIRSVPPGTMYFEAFHMLPWYGMACMFCALVVDSISLHRNKAIMLTGFILFVVWAFAAPSAFVWEKVDKLTEFESQYAKYSHYSSAIKILTTPSQKIFLDMWDDVIYWESDRDSAYPYSLYIPVAAGVSPYKEARTAMFTDNPPAVYYSCPQLQSAYNSLPQNIESQYTQLLASDKPSCLYVYNLVLVALPAVQREALVRLGFSEPKVR